MTVMMHGHVNITMTAESVEVMRSVARLRPGVATLLTALAMLPLGVGAMTIGVTTGGSMMIVASTVEAVGTARAAHRTGAVLKRATMVDPPRHDLVCIRHHLRRWGMLATAVCHRRPPI